MTPRLSEATLALAPAWVRRPPERPPVRVLHLGIGAFHRAHQAAVFDALGWGVAGASLRSPAVREAMVPQDCLYSLVVGEEVRVIGAVREVIHGADGLAARLASAETKLVTLTVTEKGYLPGAAAIRVIADGLAGRREPLTMLSCDNLPRNGERLAQAVIEASDPARADWIRDHVAFPQTMVDRIVPATEESDIEALATRIGLTDRAMVKAEPYCQWVIEDRFLGLRPNFEAAGVQITADIGLWEDAKLRLLNGAHSAIAYLGGLAGVEFVHQFVADAAGRRFVEALWDEAQTTLDPPAGLDLAAYRGALMTRFANAGLQHRTRQIAMDGSQKLPQRLLAPIAARIEQGRSIDALALAVAAWMRWQGGRDDQGTAFTVDDPLAGETRRRLAGQAEPEAQVRALLALDTVFPPALAANPHFARTLTAQLGRLAALGARGVIEQNWDKGR